jgi:hypothetical protein
VKVGRPKFHSGYGIADGDDGLLPWEWADERLAAARNYWVVTASGGGPPQTSPVWGLWLDGAFVFGTNPLSPKARNIERDPRVVVHLESGDEVVMLHGRAEPLDAGLAPRVGEEYERKYAIALEPGEGWYALRPTYAHAWLEQDYPKTATRIDF